MADTAREYDSILARHAELVDAASDAKATRAELLELGELETALQAFRAACTRSARHCLMATGLVWDDELRNPVQEGMVARVRLGDRVIVDGVEMDIAAATGLVSKAAGRSAAIAGWSGAGIRLGDAFGLEHPARAKAVEAETGSNYLLL